MSEEIILGRKVAVRQLEYFYSHESNVADFGGTGIRDLIIEVQGRSIDGELGEISRIRVSNPAPDMSAIDLRVVAMPGGLYVEWLTYRPMDRDFDHFEVQIGLDSDPESFSLKVVRPKYHTDVYIPNLTDQLQRWLRVMPYDAFGPGTPTPVVTATPLAPTV